VREQTIQPSFVRLPVQRFAEQVTQQTPELIARVRVVLARRKRGLGRETAEDQASDPPVDDRGKALQARR